MLSFMIAFIRIADTAEVQWKGSALMNQMDSFLDLYRKICKYNSFVCAITGDDTSVQMYFGETFLFESQSETEKPYILIGYDMLREFIGKKIEYAQIESVDDCSDGSLSIQMNDKTVITCTLSDIPRDTKISASGVIYFPYPFKNPLFDFMNNNVRGKMSPADYHTRAPLTFGIIPLLDNGGCVGVYNAATNRFCSEQWYIKDLSVYIRNIKEKVYV